MSFKNKIYNTYKNIAESVIPDLKTNNFIKTGMLTKDDFIKTGNYLIQNYSQWSWHTNGTCLKLSDILYKKQIFEKNEKYDNDVEEKHDWNIYSTTSFNNIEEKEMSISDSDNELENMTERGLVKEDEATINSKYNNDNNHYYDITITYDQYYRTPRIWFYGKYISGECLEDNIIYNDFSLEHTNITITNEEHPILKKYCISVHPCKHAYAMKRMLLLQLENNKDIIIEKYLIYFLKFVSCIIPQMNFDYTKM